MTKKQIEKRISKITELLKRPQPDLERLLLHEDRKQLRAMLRTKEAT